MRTSASEALQANASSNNPNLVTHFFLGVSIEGFPKASEKGKIGVYSPRT
jgi:hypothetical protein